MLLMLLNFSIEIYRLHGLTTSIVLDCHTRFLNHIWRSMWRLVNTSLNFSSAYNTQTNSDIEVLNRSLGNLLCILVGDHLKSWDVRLCQDIFSHNNVDNHSTRLVLSTLFIA